ncbi:MAG: orotidine-5'-phosphate decarboxylase [Cyanobacteria bacterium]|nr:orotidine-5'-phosphate decarboxylase [Cyanobacteriota bacterium]MDA0866330.1 orotidine-5'-phosphate decarboxylase [Cyanobacteriota bacterium]
MTPQDRIIVPLDVPTEAEALALVEQLPEVTFWKVGLELFVSSGPGILEALKMRQKRIFLDLKLHDIPNTMAGACRAAGRYGVDLLTVHATAGKAALIAAQEAVQAGAAQANLPPPQIIAVTVLTSIQGRSLALELKVPLELTDYALQLALLAQDSGLSGVVCSPQEAQQLRSSCGDELLLVCPGVRPKGSQIGDQSRVMTPIQAIQAGADYLVIGRPITQSPNPMLAYQGICDELNQML